MNIVMVLKIIAEIIKLIAEGMSQSEAFAGAACMFNISVEDVENIWNHWGH